jgi:type I restriction enzyme S subunit
MSGALEAREKLRQLNGPKDALHTLTSGHAGGIYNGPMFKRNFVQTLEHGVPFLSSGTMLRADLSNLPLLRRKDAESSRLSYLRLRAGTTLISCSGTIGRMSYVRPDMDGIWSSQDVLKIVPDTSKIPAGYLYAFLSCRYGVPLVVSGTYGAIIQHIEPEHVSSIEVPRFDASLEASIDERIQTAAKLRGSASKQLLEVSEEFDSHIPNLDLLQPPKLQISSILSSAARRRLDAQFHNPLAVQIRAELASIPHATIAEWCDDLFLPGIFKRIHVSGPEFAAPYYTGYSLFWNEPEPKGYLSRATSLFEQVQLREGMVLVQAFGQEGGLTGSPVWVGRHLEGATTTHMLVRLIVNRRDRAAYLFGFLNSRLAYKQISCLTFGGSIPHFDESGIGSVLVPRLSPEREAAIATRVLSAVSARDQALSLELEARVIVEQAISGAG